MTLYIGNRNQYIFHSAGRAWIDWVIKNSHHKFDAKRKSVIRSILRIFVLIVSLA
jgi:hypothetical protein